MLSVETDGISRCGTVMDFVVSMMLDLSQPVTTVQVSHVVCRLIYHKFPSRPTECGQLWIFRLHLSPVEP